MKSKAIQILAKVLKARGAKLTKLGDGLLVAKAGPGIAKGKMLIVGDILEPIDAGWELS